MDQAEVMVGVEDDGGGLATCGRAVRRCTVAPRSCQRRRGGGSGSTEVRKVERESRRC